jgi:glycine/D-amino acid oxidase-like deaminating enzyme
VGLSVALKLKENFSSAVDVTIIAENYFQGTTSFGSGGFWEPYAIAGTPDEDINRWGQIAFDHFKEEHLKETAAESGVQLITVHQLYESHETLKIPSWSHIVYNFQVLDEAALRSMGLPKKYVKGYSFGSYVADQKYYLQFLMKKLTKLGVRFVQRKVESLSDLYGQYDCVINCSGLGAFNTINDTDMYPIRGQVLRVKAPWMKGVWFFGNNYVIPNTDNVVLGGTQQKGNWDTRVDIKDTEMILNRVGEMFPALSRAPIVSSIFG